MAKVDALLLREWDAWKGALKKIVESRNARLHFPNLNIRQEDGLTCAMLSHPICIFDAPPKASTTRLSSDKLIVIFVSGELKFADTETGSVLVESSCSAAFFKKTKNVPANSLGLQMTDSLHFDAEVSNKLTPFHPIFHVQRGTSRISSDACKDVLASLIHIDRDKIDVPFDDTVGILKSPCFRIPTPQLDILSVLTLIIADYFCNTNAVTNIAERFQEVLRLLASDGKPAREGASARLLRSRVETHGHLSAGIWYAEFV
ncbi:MAG: hypothetical protein JWN23_2425 [Rhodocyclales bacterium]|nr:hypothetical protein [Rhodocyclales bacterium]